MSLVQIGFSFWFSLLIGACNGSSTDTDTDTDVFENVVALTFDDQGAYNTAAAEDSIEAPGNRDFFKFETVQGQLYVVHAKRSTSKPGKPDTVLRAHDKNGTELVAIDDIPYRVWETDAGLFFSGNEKRKNIPGSS